MSSLLGLLGLVVVNAFLAAARAAFMNVPPSRLQERVVAGDSSARVASLVAEDSSRLLTTLRFGQMLTRFLFAGALALTLAPAVDTLFVQIPALASQSFLIAFLLTALVGAILLIAIGELLPEALILRDAESWAIRLAPFVILLEWVVTPFARLLFRLASLVAAPIGSRTPTMVTAEEIRVLVEAGEEGGAIEQDERQMIDSIFRFGATTVREVMIPRIDVVALDVETPLGEALDRIIAAGFSRIPVYKDTVDNVMGVLYAKDMLKVWQDGEAERGLSELLRPAYFVPETKKVDDLLSELQAERVHIAIVVDEYGGMAGVVTLEDIVEEIIGEIQDEYDLAEEVLFEQVGENEYLAHGRMDIDDLNYLLDTNLDTKEADTLGGFIYGQVGRVPDIGQQIESDGLLLEVKNVVGRRIQKVRVLRLPDAPPENGSNARE